MQAVTRQLCGFELRVAKVGRGSASAGRVRDLTAGKLTPKLSDRIADVRGRQYLSGALPPPIRGRKADGRT
jgi:hypothetical protein